MILDMSLLMQCWEKVMIWNIDFPHLCLLPEMALHSIVQYWFSNFKFFRSLTTNYRFQQVVPRNATYFYHIIKFNIVSLTEAVLWQKCTAMVLQINC